MNAPGVIPPSSFPQGGRRLLVYVVYDRRGDVGEYIPYALAGLRPHADHILVVVNGSLSDTGRAALEPACDEILLRPNVGFDIAGHRDALRHLGERVEEFDEIVLANDTWYGPVRSFGPVFERMDAREVHFWGMTEHPEQRPHPFTGVGVMPRHLQSFWIVVRREMFASQMWRRYWRDLPEISSYNDAILRHETVFTETFERAGYVADVAFPSSGYPSEHPAIFHADLLVRDGCPLMKRRPFFHHPTFLVRHAVIGQDLLSALRRYGYPTDLVMEDLARNVPPRTLNADLSLLTVADPTAARPDAAGAARVHVVVRGARAGDFPLLAEPLSALPAGTPVRLLAEDAAAAAEVHAAALAAGLAAEPSAEADGGGAFSGFADLVDEDRADVLIVIDGVSVREPDSGVARTVLREQRASFLWDADSARTALSLFDREPRLGLLFPAMPRLGSEDRTQRWPTDRPRVAAACDRLGIRVPVDEFGPLYPAAGLWMARPAAIRALVRADAPGPELAEQLLAYAAGEAGFYTRTLIGREPAAVSHSQLEYSLDRLLATTYGYRLEQIQFLQRAGWRGSVAPRELLRMHTRLNHPDGTHPLLPAFRVLRRLAGSVRRAVRTGVRSR